MFDACISYYSAQGDACMSYQYLFLHKASLYQLGLCTVHISLYESVCVIHIIETQRFQFVTCYKNITYTHLKDFVLIICLLNSSFLLDAKHPYKLHIGVSLHSCIFCYAVLMHRSLKTILGFSFKACRERSTFFLRTDHFHSF